MIQINRVPSSTGYTWIRQGIWLFKQSPFTFLMLVFLYIFVVQMSMFIPIVGFVIVLILSPVLSVGFLTACQKVIRKEVVKPTIYLSPFRDYAGPIRTRLIQLGSIYTLFIVLLSVVAAQFVDVEKIIPLLTEGKLTGPALVKEMYLAMCVAVTLYLPIAILMWFSPQLIAWKNLSIPKALFGSWMAFWLNKGAFFVYFSTWGIILVAIPLFLGAFFEAIQLGEYASFIITPLSMAAITVLYCTFFATWKGCFIDNAEKIPPVL
jgi:hypothetical protein